MRLAARRLRPCQCWLVARVGTDPVVQWLLRTDPAVVYQVRRDLLDEGDPSERALIARSGSAAVILAARRPDGHWGQGFYQPKWTCTHYTLLELRDHQIDPGVAACREAVALCLEQMGQDGGVNPSGTITHSDVCINGMFLAVAAYFRAGTPDLTSLVDFILSEQVGDGGFNCRSNRSGCRVSSVHTTCSVIDGFTEYLRAGHGHRADDVEAARGAAVECLLARRLYQQKATGEPVHPEVVKLHHPPRWHFDVLRGLEVVTAAGVTHDERLRPTVDVLRGRRRPDGRWAANAGYPGATHVDYTRAGTPNPWVTLRALRVIRALSTL
ncbi:hypothetical protein GA707_18065 [Nostocoides sp. F2B08]|nr:hypothetical protein GA707_18065 [Tetrasphaera sp. F2B08]